MVSEIYYPDETSTGYYMTRIAETLAKKHAVSVFCGQPNYSARGLSVPRQETHNGVEIKRCFSTRFNKDNMVLRLINVFSISFSIFFTAFKHVRRNDLILVVTNPPLLPYIILIVSYLRKTKFLLRIDDVYPDVLVATGMIQKVGMFYRIVNLFTKILYSSANGIVVLGRDMKLLVSQRMGSNENCVEIIPNWADIDQVSPMVRGRNSLLKELGLENKFVVQCAGNMGRAQGIECLFEAMRRLRNETNIHFLFIGSGAKREWLESSIKMNNLDNVTLLPNRPRNDQSNFLNACDIAISSLIPDMLGVSVPSRIYNIFAAGKPILAVADSDSELALTVREEKIGWVVPPGEPGKIVEAIFEARAHPETLEEMGRRARGVAETKYSCNKILDFYLSIISDM